MAFSFFSSLPVSLRLENGDCLELVSASAKDASVLHELESDAHSHPMGKSLLRNNLERYACVAVKRENEWVGFALVSVVAGEAELLDLVVSSKHQGQGIGRALLTWIIDQLSDVAERFFLEVRASNDPAQALYENTGFVEVGLRPKYYPAEKGREDAILMAMELNV